MNPLSPITSFLNNPAVNKGLSAVRNPGPYNLDILPLEASVTGGRSAWAWVRTGFLELQERFFEEVAAAIVWLGGVKAFDTLYEKALKKVKPEVDLAIDWSADRWKSMDLSPLERYTKTLTESRSVLRYKMLGKFLSIGASLFLVAIAIPWLNQKKTEWILKKFYQKPDAQPQPAPNPWSGYGAAASGGIGQAGSQSNPLAGMGLKVAPPAFGTGMPVLGQRFARPQGQPYGMAPAFDGIGMVPSSPLSAYSGEPVRHQLLKNAYGGDTRFLPEMEAALPSALADESVVSFSGRRAQENQGSATGDRLASAIEWPAYGASPHHPSQPDPTSLFQSNTLSFAGAGGVDSPSTIPASFHSLSQSMASPAEDPADRSSAFSQTPIHPSATQPTFSGQSGLSGEPQDPIHHPSPLAPRFGEHEELPDAVNMVAHHLQYHVMDWSMLGLDGPPLSAPGHSTPKALQHPSQYSTTALEPAHPLSHASPSAPTGQPEHVPKELFAWSPASTHAPPLHFGGGFAMDTLGRAAIEGMSKVGAFQSNVPYGDILVVDAGITGGRFYMGQKRDFFEGLEYVNRDVVSLYFYLLSKPHLMILMNLLALKVAQTSLRMDPQLGTKLEGRVQRFLRNHNTDGQIALADAKQMLMGESGTVAKALNHFISGNNSIWMADALRTVPQYRQQSMLDHVAAELRFQLGQEQGTEVFNTLKKSLPQGEWHVNALTDVLTGIRKEGKLPRAGLSQAVVDDAASRALKYGLRHHVGIDSQALMDQMTEILAQEGVDAAGRERLQQRIQQMSKRDGLTLATTALERMDQLLGHATGGVDAPVREQLAHLMEWVEKSSIRQMTPAQAMAEEIREVGQEILSHRALKQNSELVQLVEQLESGLAKTSPEWDQQALAKLMDSLEQASKGKGKAKKLLAQLESFKPLLSDASHQTVNLDGWIETRLQGILDQLTPQWGTGAAAEDMKALWNQYRGDVQGYLRNGGPVFWLESGTMDTAPGLRNKVEEMLLGGLMRDKSLERQGLRLTSALPDSWREFFSRWATPKVGKRGGIMNALGKFLNPYGNPSESMQGAITQFMKTLEQRLPKGTGMVAVEDIEHAVSNYVRKSRIWNNGALILSLVASAFGLGILVPKFQYYVTRMLTGEDTHPGIKAVEEQLGTKVAHNGNGTAAAAQGSSGTGVSMGPVVQPAYSSIQPYVKSGTPLFLSFQQRAHGGA